MKKYDLGMSVERLTVSFEADLAEAVRDAASADSMNMSAWLAEAARRHLASRGLGEVVTEWEAQYGAFSEVELAAARHRLNR
jgi:hypothetical protein